MAAPTREMTSVGDKQAFHDFAVKVKPENLAAFPDATHFVIAVLNPGCDPRVQNPTDSHVWLKSKRNLRFSKVRDSVAPRFRLAPDARFLVWGKEPGPDDLIGSLDNTGSKIIAVQVITSDSAALHPQADKQPLAEQSGNIQPSSTQATTKPVLSLQASSVPPSTSTATPSQDRNAGIQAWAANTAAHTTAMPSPSISASTNQDSSSSVRQTPVDSAPAPTSPVTHEPGKKLYKDGIDAFRQHAEAQSPGMLRRFATSGEKPLDDATKEYFEAVLNDNQQRHYNTIAALDVPLRLFEKEVINKISSALGANLTAWQRQADLGRRPAFPKTDYDAAQAVPKLPNAGEAEPTSKPLEFQGYFADDTQQQGQPEPEVFGAYKLQDLLADGQADKVEALLEKGIEYLDRLKKPLVEKQRESSEASEWVDRIHKLQAQAGRTRTIIGVVGNTGSGKSSMINALLDEERLVPTNAMRACTAVVTELSWNYEPDETYRAEIEFISLDSWAADLKILFEDLLDANGNVSKDCTDDNSDAGVAYAKIKAVYPTKTKEDIAHSNVDTLIDAVKGLLGTTKTIREQDPGSFYRGLQHYVDSKEKTKPGQKKKKDAPPPAREYWPLIKCVRIYTKSPALATGAVVVDLPGVHDANAARAAVAESYLKQCTGLWIVAPIIRAVDDKAAKTLLGETFKRQLKMDGGYSDVTFICSKTDDFSITEVTQSLGLEEDRADLFDELNAAKQRKEDFMPELEALRDERRRHETICNRVRDEQAEWDRLADDLEDGKTVYAPSATNKRKRRGGDDGEKSKKMSRFDDDMDDFVVDDDEFIDSRPAEGDAVTDDELAEEEDAEPREPLTAGGIKAKLTEIKAEKKKVRDKMVEFAQKNSDAHKRRLEIEKDILKHESAIAQLCINSRNDYSTGAIQQDFAAGMKELDQEIAQEEDEENFNPDKDVRDYDEVARSLPVFCVSSRAYQKLCGRMVKDTSPPGFDRTEQTQIPQLQEHCKQLTVSGRLVACRAFLTNLSQLLNSLTIWADVDGAVKLSDDDKRNENNRLTKDLEKLERGFEEIVRKLGRDINEELADNIFDRYEPGAKAALERAMETCARWAAPVNRDNRDAGGFHFMTYRAIVRRDGVWSNAQGHHDFNSQLVEPFMKQIAAGWERAFTRRVPGTLTSFTVSSNRLLSDFHKSVHKRALATGNAVSKITMMDSQLSTYAAIFKAEAEAANTLINAKQRDINREFTPKITAAMHDAYVTCAAEYGPGCYNRMKGTMSGHIEQHRKTMFHDCANHVKELLREMVREVKRGVEEKLEDAFQYIQRDYRGAVLGGGAALGPKTPKRQRQMKKSVLKRVKLAQWSFESAVGIQVGDAPDVELSDDEDLTGGDNDAMDVDEDDNNDTRQTKAAFEVKSDTEMKSDAGSERPRSSIAQSVMAKPVIKNEDGPPPGSSPIGGYPDSNLFPYDSDSNDAELSDDGSEND